MSALRSAIAATLFVAGAGAAVPAYAFSLENCGTVAVPVACPYVTYGDGRSYSLSVNALLYSYASIADPAVPNTGTGPGNPFYVPSTPGAIKDLTVIGTGSSGGPVTTNYPGADDAYATPNSDGTTFFSTGTVADPGGANQFSGDKGGTWDVTLAALQQFMGTDNSLIFFFNNNQTNRGASTDQNLAAWAQITITDAAGVVVQTFDFTNTRPNPADPPIPPLIAGGKFASVFDGGGGIPSAIAPNAHLAYTHVGPLDSPNAGTNDLTDYVLSGGELCYTGNSLLTFQPVSCSTAGANRINNNLGADQAAYAVVFPELDAYLQTLFAGSLTGYSMNVNLRFGCDPATVNPQVNCVGRSLNNGYEQVFISTASNVPDRVPLPGTAFLLGAGLLAASYFGGSRRRAV